MSLIQCPECGRQVSSKAAACPGCGCPIAGEQTMQYLAWRQRKILWIARALLAISLLALPFCLVDLMQGHGKGEGLFSVLLLAGASLVAVFVGQSKLDKINTLRNDRPRAKE